MADEGWALNSRWERDGGIPTQVLIAPGMEIVASSDETGWIDESMIEEYLPE